MITHPLQNRILKCGRNIWSFTYRRFFCYINLLIKTIVKIWKQNYEFRIILHWKFQQSIILYNKHQYFKLNIILVIQRKTFKHYYSLTMGKTLFIIILVRNQILRIWYFELNKKINDQRDDKYREIELWVQ